LEEKVVVLVYKTEHMAVGICHTDHVAPSICRKFSLTSLASGGRSVGIVRSRTQATEFQYGEDSKHAMASEDVQTDAHLPYSDLLC
jgi:hypothetical protein